MVDLLVDTDVFIDHLRGARRLQTAGDGICYSVITRCELFAGTRDDTGMIQILLAPFVEILVDRPIAERAGQIRRATGTRIADALVAATALEHALALVTRNTKDFERVDGLILQLPQ